MMRRRAVLVAILLVLLAGTAGTAFHRLRRARAAAIGARSGLAACHRLAARIERLRREPAVADDRERVQAETSGPVERAAEAAGISPDRLVRITPEPAVRLGDSAYKEKPVRVLLRRVGLRQVIETVHRLARGDGGLRVKALRLSAPGTDATSNEWTAEVVLTYLIYEPAQAGL